MNNDGISDVPTDRLTYIALLSGQVGQSMTFVMLSAVLPLIALHFGGGLEGERIAQQMAGFPFLGLTVGGLLSGPICRRLTLRPTVLLSASLFAAAGSVPLFTDTAPPMFIGAFVTGLSASLLTSASSGVAGEVIAADKLARLVSYQVALGLLSSVIIGFLAAIAAQRFGWRAPFAGYAIMGAVIWVVNFAGLPSARLRGESAGGVVIVLRAVWPVCLVAMLTFVVVTLQPAYLPFYMIQQGIASTASRAGLLMISTAAAFFGSMAFSYVQGRMPAYMIATLPVAMLIAAFLLYATWTGSVPVIAIALGLSGLGAGMIIPALFSAAIARAPHAAAQSVGFLNVAIFAGSFATPYLLSAPRQYLGISGLFWFMCGTIAITGVVVQLLSARRRPTVS